MANIIKQTESYAVDVQIGMTTLFIKQHG